MSLVLRATTTTVATKSTRARTRPRGRRTRPASTLEIAPQAVELTWANRRPGSAGFARWAAYIGEQIDQHGLAATAPAIDALVILADQLGVVPVAVRVLADPTEPEPARLRAFAHVVQALVEPRRRSPRRQPADFSLMRSSTAFGMVVSKSRSLAHVGVIVIMTISS